MSENETGNELDLKEYQRAMEQRSVLAGLNERNHELQKKRDRLQAELNEAKNAIKKTDAETQSVIDEFSGPQMRLDFDAAEQARKDKKDAANVKKNVTASNKTKAKPEAKAEAKPEPIVDPMPEPTVFGAWQDVPVTQLATVLDKTEAAWVKSVEKTGSRTLGQLADLIDKKNEAYPDGLASIKSFGPLKVQKITEAFESIKAKYDQPAEEVTEEPAEEVVEETVTESRPENGTEVTVKVLSIGPNHMGIEAGHVVKGIQNGRMVMVNGDDGSTMSLMSSEYAYAEAEGEYEDVEEPEPEAVAG